MTITVDDPKAAIKASWGAAAEGWDRWFAWYERNFRPVIAWCCEAAALRPGTTVLDIACGTGQPAIAAARAVHPGGQVVATDIAPEMLAVAERRATQAGLHNIEFKEADAETLPFPDQSFDAVTCAFALMFCPDMDRAVAEVHRVLKPGGRVAYVVWDAPSKSPFLTAAGQSVARFFPAQPPSPDAPGPFRLAPPGALEGLLRANGFNEVTVASRPMTLECASVEEYWRMFTDHAAGIKTKIAQLNETDLAALMSTLDEAVRPYLDNGSVRLVATPLCGSGRRSLIS